MRNSYVYNEIEAFSLSEPDIEVTMTEHFAQRGEDLIVAAILKALAQAHGLNLLDERYLEIGANHPIATSATYLLHKMLGMRGVLVEANTALIEELQKARPYDVIVNKAIHADDATQVKIFISNQSELSSLSEEFVEDWQGGAVGIKETLTIEACRMDALFDDHFGDHPPIYMSVDVESLDLVLLQDLNWKRWRPSVVQAEPSEHFIIDNGKHIIEFMTSIDYTLVAATDVNLIFVDGRKIRSNKIFEHTNGNSAVEEKLKAEEKRNDVMASVGVVTRTKDRIVLLRRALESVKNQTYSNWQLVVVNDGGESEAVDWLVGEIMAGDPRVRVIHHAKSKGMEAASNAGLAILETDYAVIHDDDDSWAPEFMATMTSAIRRQKAAFPSVKGIACGANVVNESVVGNEVIIESVTPFSVVQEGFLNLQKMLESNQFPPIVFMFDLLECKRLGMFNDTLPVLGDWDFHVRFALKHDIWMIPDYLSFYHHRVSATGSLGNTVHAGVSKHQLYNRLIQNNLIRDAVGPTGDNRMSLMLLTELRRFSEDRMWHLERVIDHRIWHLEGLIQNRKLNRPRWRKKLSMWFRHQKERVLKRKRG